MFLSERRGEVKLPKLKEKRILSDMQMANDSISVFEDEALEKKAIERRIAETEMVGGVEMISAFVTVKGGGFSEVEALGAVMQTKFNDKLAAMLLPADRIEKIADLSCVTGIEVAEVLQPLNDKQREVTQAGDAITNSAAAQALGLTKQYTGKNVILGIIDTGIDFQHIAFKDKNGNSRIVRAYKLQSANSTSLTTYSTASQISGLTYDTNDEDHGTHTSSTAGGSSVIVDGSTVTVTDDHANATYGGMAPEADLVIAGLSSLYTTSIGTAIQNICNYADQVGKPCVISLSLGSQVGPHDGTGTIASIVNQCAGNNHIIVYAASNDGMRANAFSGASGGMYASGTSTSSKPMIVNVQRNFSNADGNVEMLMPTIVAYARTANVATALKFHVVNVKTGAIVYSSSAYTSSTTISVTGSNGLAQYFKSNTQYSNQYGDAGAIRLIRSQDANNNKYYWQVYAPIMLSTSYNDNDGDGIYNSDYAFCVSVYPTSTSSSTIIDMWENTYCWFGTDLNLSSSSYNYCPGNDECSVSDNATYSKVISVGAYVTKNSITDYSGATHDFSEEYPNIGDHASFSSWQTAGYGPLGTPLPHINAPGARIVAGVNHYHTASIDDYSYYGDNFKTDLVVNSSTYPYAAMEGTSMATPCASGIIAQWLQACVEAGKTPTPDYIKEVMAATWDTDQWTNGAGHGAKTFGTHGKINAIKGIQYILGCSSGPVITASPESLTFSGYATQTYTQTVAVTGTNLSQNITASLTGANVYSIDKTSLGTNGGTITVTYAPTAAGNTNATLTLSSTGASTVTVPITGTAQAATPTLIVDKTSLTYDIQLGESSSQTVTVSGRFLSEDVSVTLTDANNVFSVDKTSLDCATLNNDGTLTVAVTFNSANEGTFTGTLNLTSGNVLQSVALTGTANDTPTYIYVLTNTLTAGNEYLIVSSNSAGSAYAMGHNNTTVASDAVTINSDASVSDAVYIESDDVDATSLWTAESSGSLWKFKNGIYYATVSSGWGSRSLTFATSSSNNWTQGTNQLYYRGSFSSYYLRYSNNTFSVTTSANNIYLYEKTQVERKPSLTASPTGIDFIAEPGETITETITVTGVRLTEDVTVTLTDDNGVYTLDKSNISIAEATNGATVTVTFNAPQAMGSYRGQATFTSGSASTKTVFYGAVGEKGTAYSNYLDIAQYQTIATGNWYDGIFANAYKWNEYEDDECAWLTLPAALPYYAWNYNDQNWCGVSSNSTGGWYGHQWTATDVFQGSTYFATAIDESTTGTWMLGPNVDSDALTTNTAQYYGYFNVTNCTQAKAYGYNNSGVSSNYAAFLAVYELTENADGTVTLGGQVDWQSSTTTSSTVIMTSAELDASKIYRVYVGGYRNFFYEVAFRTPLVTIEATLADIEKNGTVGQKYKVSDKLLAVYAAPDMGILWCKDLNNASNNPTTQQDGQIDYMSDVVGEQASEWDQSNWIALQFSKPSSSDSEVLTLLNDAVGKYITAGTIVGTYSNASNYTFTMAEDALTLEENRDEQFIPNVYCTANFLPQNLNINGGLGAPGRYHGENVYYFFMNPKIQEVCTVTYAEWDGEKFIVPVNNSQIDGAFYVDWAYNDGGTGKPETGSPYRFTAVVQRTVGSNYLKAITGEASDQLVVYPLDFVASSSVITAIDGVFTDGYREIVGVDYVNTAGMISNEPFKGVNIVVTRYSDGSTSTVKKICK